MAEKNVVCRIKAGKTDEQDNLEFSSLNARNAREGEDPREFIVSTRISSRRRTGPDVYRSIGHVKRR
jgi:hypothetical protein